MGGPDGDARSRCFRRRVAGAPLLGVLAALAFFPAAGAFARPPNTECLACHGDRTSGVAYVDTLALRASTHARLACASCHAGVTSLPHEPKLPRVRCESCHAAAAGTLASSVHGQAGRTRCADCHGTHAIRPALHTGPALCGKCHGKVSNQYRESIHGVALAHGDSDASTCADCHGAIHALRTHLDPASPVSHSRIARTCARCHADRALTTRRKITIPEAYQTFHLSVHGRSKRPDAAVCNDCHESHHLQRATDPSSSIYRTNIPATCGRCHPGPGAEYAEGVHGTAVAQGVTAAPVCTDCHGEHLIRGPGDLESPVATARVSETCSRCHEAQGIRETYGLPAGRLATYRDSFHGLAARGGSPVVANCASCHGYHRILPSKDPRSAIAPANLPATCGRCHPGAGERFAMGAVHVASATPDQPVLYWVRLAYLWLIGLTIGGMALHNGLDFAAKLRRHFAVHAGRLAPHGETVTRWYLRMTGFERAQHALFAISFFVLVYTGFALKFPEAWPFAWLARLEAGYQWRSLVHRIAAVVMVATSLAHVAYFATRRGRETLSAMVPRARDAGDLIANLLYLTGLRKTPPAFDRFGYIEKSEYWALIWGTVVMTVTGVALWFETEALQWMSKWVLDLATLVHYYEAWLAFAAIVVWHLYQTIVNPDVYPMNWTWLTGRISEEQLRHEHAAEWERVVARDPDEKPAGDAAP